MKNECAGVFDIEMDFRPELVSSEAVRQEKEDEINAFFLELFDCVSVIYSQELAAWIEVMRNEQRHGYSILINEYECSKEAAQEAVMIVCAGIFTLLGKDGTLAEQPALWKLAAFSEQVTGDPHYFDRDRFGGKLLIGALACIRQINEPQCTEDVLSLYYECGIQPDDLSSQVLLYGVRLFEARQDISGNVEYLQEHEAYRAFIGKNESYVVTLANLRRICSADSDQKTVFIVENQSVFSRLCGNLSDLPVSIMCISGQLRTAALIVLDLLCAAGCQLYYAGDFNPEGLQIAEKIVSRWPELIFPWRMGVGDYEMCISDEDVDEMRLKKLDSLKSPALLPAVQALQIVRRTGCQELLLAELEADIRENILQSFNEMCGI